MEETRMQERTTRSNGPENVSERPAVSPYVDVFENEQEILVVADLPGVARNELSINLEESELTIEGRRNPQARGTALASEYRPSDFRRSFVLPPGIDRDKVEAQLSAGVLTLRLPKSEALRPRRIEVRGG
jgi:HSP20 family protein